MGFARLAKPAGRAAQAVSARTPRTPRADGGPSPRGLGLCVGGGGGNRTGLPDGLKAGLEGLSGLSMDAVRVHYGSARPAQIDALAYADGTDIHLAPGQERHLPHEAWHVVQQAEGRVFPTVDLGGTAINDDTRLEREADRMGDASVAYGRSRGAAERGTVVPSAGPVAAPAGGVVQGKFTIDDGPLKGDYDGKTTKATNNLIVETRNEIGDELGVGWVGTVRDWAAKEVKRFTFADTDAYYDRLRAEHEKEEKEGKVRPNFSSGAYKLAKIAYGLQTGKDESDMKPSDLDLAMPHRFPFGAIKRSTELFLDGTEDGDDLDRWSGRLEVASAKRLKRNEPKITKKIQKVYYSKEVESQISKLRKARKNLKEAKKNGAKLTLHSPETQEFMKAANDMHGNIPGFGPHTKINIPVSNRIHFNFDIPDQWDGKTKVPMSPGSEQAALMSPHRSEYALDKTGKYVPTTGGEMMSIDLIEGFEHIDQFGSMTTIDPNLFKRYD